MSEMVYKDKAEQERMELYAEVERLREEKRELEDDYKEAVEVLIPFEGGVDGELRLLVSDFERINAVLARAREQGLLVDSVDYVWGINELKRAPSEGFCYYWQPHMWIREGIGTGTDAMGILYGSITCARCGVFHGRSIHLEEGQDDATLHKAR